MKNNNTSGIHDNTVFKAVTRMVSSGKHSLGNWVFESRALLLSSELPPVFNDWEKNVQQMIPI
jgi:hypothetical protein